MQSGYFKKEKDGKDSARQTGEELPRLWVKCDILRLTAIQNTLHREAHVDAREHGPGG